MLTHFVAAAWGAIRGQRIKDRLHDSLGPLYGPVHSFVWEVVPFFSPSGLNWVFVLSTIAIATALYYRRRAPGTPATLRAWWQFLAPRQVFLHPSALADYKFYLANAAVLTQLKLGVFVGTIVGLLITINLC